MCLSCLSVEGFRRRICGRGTETPDRFRDQARSATEEMSDLKDYDYVIINSDLDRAVERLLAIVAGERARFQEEDA